MCGIAGFVGAGDGAVLRRMTDRLVHRGPDAQGFFEKPEAGVFLGHRRLSIIDLSGGAQPMSTADGQTVIVFNGEIYNHADLRAELQARGHVFATDHSDTEVLLYAWREWGPAMLDRLNGMWAFVIYDTSNEILFCSRDRVGVKPFYYFIDENKFLFASEQKAILHSQLIAKKINKQSAFDYLSFNETEHHPQGMIEGIIELPPAHPLIVNISSAQISVQQYYSLQVNLEAATDRKSVV